MSALKRSCTTAAIVSCLIQPTAAAAKSPPPTVSIGVNSQQVSAARASVSASIAAKSERPGARPTTGKNQANTQTPPQQGGSGSASQPVYPALASNAPLLQNPHPLGPGTFWYTDGLGHVCVYVANSSPLCYSVIASGGRTPAPPRVNPAVIAAEAAARLELSPGRILVSPVASRGGLTGVDSWFWLAPAPARETLSVSLAGESVRVSAEPTVEWQFGDGARSAGGAGRPYEPGPPLPGSVRHRYQTRCLPGDAGRDAYVLASCARRGYEVEALVNWAISYQASGPVSARGALPGRTTSAGLGYPVSEARAFLVGGGG